MRRLGSVCEVDLGSQGSFLAGRSLQGFDEVELVSVLTGKNGCFLVVLDELVHSVETPLPDAINALAALHLEVLVLAGRLQGDGQIAWLKKETDKNVAMRVTVFMKYGKKQTNKSKIGKRKTCIQSRPLGLFCSHLCVFWVLFLCDVIMAVNHVRDFN